MNEPSAPLTLREIETVVMASTQPAVIMVDRPLMRELLLYVRRLEANVRTLRRDIAAEGYFW